VKWLYERLRALMRRLLRGRGVLTGLGFIEESRLTDFLTKHYGAPSIDLGKFEVAPDVIGLLDRESAETHRVFPVNRVGGSLIIAMEDANDEAGRATLSELTGLVVEPVVASAEDISAAIERYYGSRDD